MRLFVAIGADDLNFDPKEALKKLKVNLNKKEIEYRWVPQENYHITLNFLGEVDPTHLDLLRSTLTELSQRHSIFHLKLDGLGAFPTLKEGRVIWMDVQNSKELRSLQEDCQHALSKLGFELETKAYVPHLTLCRLRSPRNLSDMMSPLIKQKFGEMAVKTLTLYESKLGGSFPIYEPVFKFPLRPRDFEESSASV